MNEKNLINYHITFNDTLAYKDKEYSIKVNKLEDVYDELKKITSPNAVKVTIKIVKMKEIKPELEGY